MPQPPSPSEIVAECVREIKRILWCVDVPNLSVINKVYLNILSEELFSKYYVEVIVAWEIVHRHYKVDPPSVDVFGKVLADTIKQTGPTPERVGDFTLFNYF